MKKTYLAFITLILGILIVFSCTKPTPIGAELLEGDRANIKYSDTLTIHTSTVSEDSVLVFDFNSEPNVPNITANNFFIGDFNDPVFGNVKANLITQLWPANNSPNFKDAVLDSLVLLLRYDSLNIYGDVTSDPYRLGVYELSENLNFEDYYSNKEVFYDEVNLLGETADFIPKYGSADMVKVLDYALNKADTITLLPHVRIHLSQALGNTLLNIDSSVYASNTEFLKQFSGIVVKALNPTKGILSFSLTSVSSMILYYHQDTIYKQFKYLPNATNGVRFSTFRHDMLNSIAGDFIDNPAKGDSLVFIQSLSGPNIKVELPHAENFGDIIVNKAELTFTFAELEEDDISTYPPLQRAIATVKNQTDGSLVLIKDVVVGDINTNNWFGGTVRETVDNNGNTIYTYSFNISAHFQQMVDGTAEKSIFIRTFSKSQRAGRAILYGPKHSKYPVKLTLTYTDLNPN